MTVNVYVVSNCWAREGADVIGAGADLSDAMALGGDENGPWSGWDPVMVKPSGRFTKWARQSLHHPSLVQEIVMMPLAGMTGGEPLPDPDHEPIGDIQGWLAQRQPEHRTEIAEIGRSFGAP